MSANIYLRKCWREGAGGGAKKEILMLQGTWICVAKDDEHVWWQDDIHIVAMEIN